MSYTPPEIEFRVGIDRSAFNGKFGAGVVIPKKSKSNALWEYHFKQRIENMEQKDPKTFIGWALKSFWK